MKIVIICLLSVIVLVAGDDDTKKAGDETKKHERGCIYIMGRCHEECPEGTHAYTTGCGRKLPEATCDDPEPKLEEGILCDYSSCYCDPGTLRDTKSKKCVKPEECPKKE